MENLSLALQITLIGMGLVSGAILLLWLMMLVLVRLTADKSEAAPDMSEDALEQVRKRRAASAAVAAALAVLHQKDKPHAFPLPPTAVVSPWQAVMRTHHLSRRGRP